MFTGIVEDTGEVQAATEEAGGRRLRIGTDFADLDHGQSISVEGACLTVEDFEPGEWFAVFLAEETVERTALGDLAVGDPVNLERAMPADGRFDGHVVQGHVDATATVEGVESVGEGPASDASGTSSDSSDGDWRFTFSLPAALSRYVVEKGSIAVDGVSLTVADRDDDAFSVAIIPTTYAETTLSEKAVGDPVHLEVDVLAKYVERAVQDSNSVISDS